MWLRGRKLLITGASGFIGSHLAARASQDGAEVRVLLREVHPHLKQWVGQFEVVVGDVTRFESLQEACRDRDLVWHAASLNETRCRGGIRDAITVNVSGTTNVLEAARREKVGLLVKLSTFHVYGWDGSNPVTEELQPRPQSPYALSTFLGDSIAVWYRENSDLHVRVARISNAYGAPLFMEIDRWSLIVNDLTRMAYQRQEIVLRGDGRDQRDFVSIEDVFRALCLISTQQTNATILNVGGGNSKSMREVAECIKRVYDARYGTDIPISTRQESCDGSPTRLVYDIARLQSLGYVPNDSLAQEVEKILSLLETG